MVKELLPGQEILARASNSYRQIHVVIFAFQPYCLMKMNSSVNFQESIPMAITDIDLLRIDNLF